MSEINLKPCPFCGNIYITLGSVRTLGEVFAQCKKCGAQIYANGETKQDAINAWNRRLTMADIRKVEIDKEFIVRLKGTVSTDQTDKELAEIFDNLHETIKEVICNNIVDDGVVSVEPAKHGEWVYGEYDIPHCSECGAEVMPDKISNYCPNCGAKMEGERISDDED